MKSRDKMISLMLGKALPISSYALSNTTANWCLALQMTCQSTKRRERGNEEEEGVSGEDWGGC